MKMKTAWLFLMMIGGSSVYAQKDSISVIKSNDTIKIGGIVILKKGDSTEKNRVIVSVGRPERTTKSNITTSSFFADIGFANWVDKTDYAVATVNNSLVNQPGKSALSSKDFKLRTGKSINVNIWIVGQKVNLAKHYLNLKYALGLELNNYRFKNDIKFSEGGFNPYDQTQDISHAFVYRDQIHYSKNKLAADYVTIPLMLNFNSNPRYSNRGVSLSAGVSVGYLYSARNKQKSDEFGKQKNHGDYDLEKWKFSYVADLGIGPIAIYGSYAPKSIFKNDLNFQPYTIGLRLNRKW